MDPAVDQAVDSFLITKENRICAFRARLQYYLPNPFAVRLVFPPDLSFANKSSVWVFARALLDEGLRVPAGEGDVRFYPCGPLWTGAQFHGRGRVALVLFESVTMRRFLREAYAITPPGHENQHLNIDQHLDSLLTSGEDGAIDLEQKNNFKTVSCMSDSLPADAEPTESVEQSVRSMTQR
jgi:hypothetical protein